MWIYDGEEWTEEGVEERKKKKMNQAPPPEEEYHPELEIVEIPRDNYVPPPPMQ